MRYWKPIVFCPTTGQDLQSLSCVNKSEVLDIKLISIFRVYNMQTMEVATRVPAQCLTRPTPARNSKTMTSSELLAYLGDAGVQFGIPFTSDGPDWEQSMLNCFEILWQEDNYLFFKMREEVYKEYAKLNFSAGIFCLPEPIDTSSTFFCDPMGHITEADHNAVTVVNTHCDETGKRQHMEFSCFVPVDLFQSWLAKGKPADSFREYRANAYQQRENISELL